jgi:hypothetical protein
MVRNRREGIVRTAWIETARRRKERRNEELVAANEEHNGDAHAV